MMSHSIVIPPSFCRRSCSNPSGNVGNYSKTLLPILQLDNETAYIPDDTVNGLSLSSLYTEMLTASMPVDVEPMSLLLIGVWLHGCIQYSWIVPM